MIYSIIKSYLVKFVFIRHHIRVRRNTDSWGIPVAVNRKSKPFGKQVDWRNSWLWKVNKFYYSTESRIFWCLYQSLAGHEEGVILSVFLSNLQWGPWKDCWSLEHIQFLFHPSEADNLLSLSLSLFFLTAMNTEF